MSTNIEWTDETWNPIVGCSRVSPGCDNCYAISSVHRGAAMGTVQHQGLTVHPEGDRLDWNGKVNVAEHLMDKPLHWAKPRRIFVNSLSDLFHPSVPSHVIRQIWRVMVEAEQHTFQVLTKRPQRMAAWVQADNEITVPTPPNIWLGVSIESDKYAWRADHLRATPAAVRFISAEPLLGPLPSLDLTGIDWLIVGGESGAKARPMHPDWVRDLRDRCQDEGRGVCPTCDGRGSIRVKGGGAACGDCYVENHGGTGRVPTAFLFKQWGNWHPAPWKLRRHRGEPLDDYKARSEAEAATHSLAPWDGGFHRLDHQPWSSERAGEASHPHAGMRRGSKTEAGRLLDGRTWDEFPEAVS